MKQYWKEGETPQQSKDIPSWEKKTVTFSDGVLHTPGIDYGRPLEILYSKGGYYLTRTKGHLTWSGQGTQEYYPTHYRIFMVLPRKEHQSMYAVEIVEEAPGKKWKPTVEKLKMLIDEWASQDNLRRAKRKE